MYNHHCCDDLNEYQWEKDAMFKYIKGPKGSVKPMDLVQKIILNDHKQDHHSSVWTRHYSSDD